MHGIYYQCLSDKTIRNNTKQLTLNQHIMACLLVALALATDLVSQPVTLMAKCLAMLENWVPLHQLALDTEDQ